MSRDVDDDHGSSLFFPNGDSSDVNSRILFIAIVTLSAVVVVVVMLHVYVRYILRRQARRQVTGVGLIARVHSDEAPKQGLEASVIASLPVLKYEGGCHDHELDRSGQNPECTVCLSLFDNGQMIRVLPNCKHNFHVECIDKWLESHSSCPVCRHEVEVGLTILPLPREPSARLGVGVGSPSAPPLERAIAIEGTSDEMVQSSIKGNGTSSRLSSFRRMLSMDRSSRRNNSCTQDGIDDLERQ